MAVNVVKLTTEAQFQRMHDLLEMYFDVEVQCSPRNFYPSLGQIRRAPHVYVARNNTTPVVGALVENDGRILWLNGQKARLLEGAVALFDQIHTDLGACWGVVKNPTVRARLVEASGAAGHVDGERIWWQP
ncbi:MAG: hypothetical protein ABW156_05805 [Jiangellaceae bacterium]